MALVGGIGGGVTRDVMLGQVPGALTNPAYVTLCLAFNLAFAEGRLVGRKSILTPVGSTAVDVHPSWVMALRAPLCSVASNGPREGRIEDMSVRPVFIYAATYASPRDADADYEGLLELHAADLVGTYDVAIINKDVEGKVHVKKHEKPTQHGAWTGIGVGAVVGILFPPSIIGAAAVGGLTGGVIGHLARGMSRGDMKDLGELLDDGQAALVVVGESRVQEQLDKALTRAQKSMEKEIDADSKAFERELKQAETEAATG